MSLTKPVNSKSNIKQYSGADLPVQPKQPAIARYAAESTANQTVISLPFQVDTVNAADSFILTVDGKTLTPGSTNDYTFTGVDSFGFTNTVTLTQALTAGLNIQGIKLGLKKEIEFAQDARFTSLYEAQDQALQGFVRTADLMVPTASPGTPGSGLFYSSITNRASIVDLRNDLKVRMGIERAETQQLILMPSEYGPNGEPVYGLANDLFGQVRFVGIWTSSNATNGPNITASTTIGDYVEITFWGSALNMLSVPGTVFDCRASVDGGAEGSNIFITTGSTFLNNRGDSLNQVVPVVSGLSPGVHTVKIRNNSTSGVNFNGFEVISDTTSFRVNPGSSYLAGKKATTIGIQTVAHNNTFETGTLGTRGGHAVIYQKADGSIAKAVNPVGSQLNLTAADHSNEEVARVYHWREFGTGRSDDLSLIAPGSLGNRAFALADGTTAITLLNSGSVSSFEAIYPGSGGIINFSFVGTGLDVLMYEDGTYTPDSGTWAVDGVSIGATDVTATISGRSKVFKIVSGLPHGSHTVTYTRTSASSGFRAIRQFITYQAKKPAVPSGAVELGDYNIPGNFVVGTSIGPNAISTGMIRKFATKEFLYSGTWSVALFSLSSAAIGGFEVSSSTTGDYIEYSFFGQAFDIRYSHSTTSTTWQLTVDGSTNQSGFTTSVFNDTGTTFTASTGTLVTSTSAASGGGLSISGLTPSMHKIRLTKTGGSGALIINAIDIAMPTHAQRSNLAFDLQNTLPVGSLGVGDSRKLSAIKDNYLQRKNISQAVGVASSPTTTSSVPVPMPDMSVVHFNNTGRIKITYSVVAVTTTTNGQFLAQPFVGGSAVASQKSNRNLSSTGNNAILPISDSIVINVAPGQQHKVDVYWLQASGATLTADNRNLTVEDV